MLHLKWMTMNCKLVASCDFPTAELWGTGLEMDDYEVYIGLGA